ncbi:MAG TPA: hypothetical protein VJ885_06005 [Thermoanaerobaculia bacterium]|nr:hypothetical protein [Thermoanaerobaculia bacterium]
MKKSVKKITLSKETLRDLETKQVLGGEGEETATCPVRGVLMND